MNLIHHKNPSQNRIGDINDERRNTSECPTHGFCPISNTSGRVKLMPGDWLKLTGMIISLFIGGAIGYSNIKSDIRSLAQEQVYSRERSELSKERDSEQDKRAILERQEVLKSLEQIRVELSIRSTKRR